MTEEREDAGMDAAPEGGSEQARPDTDATPREDEGGGEERPLEDERALADPDPEQPDRESRPSSGT